MELRFLAKHKFARCSPKKVRYVMDMIRHKPVNEALTILRFSNRRAAVFIDKVLRSALANAGEESLKKKLNIDADKLIVGEGFVDEAPVYRRWRPRSRGMANPIAKKNCHISIVLTPVDESAITKFEEKGEKKKKQDAAEGSGDAKAAETTATDETTETAGDAEATEAKADDKKSDEAEGSADDKKSDDDASGKDDADTKDKE